MGSLSSGRHPHYGGKLKQVALKFPTGSEWFMLAKRICHYKEISFNEFVRQIVKQETEKFRYTKMWGCECTDSRGKTHYNFKRRDYCNQCGMYQTKHHESLYNRTK